MQRRLLIQALATAASLSPWHVFAADDAGEFPLSRPARAIVVCDGDNAQNFSILEATLKGLTSLNLLRPVKAHPKGMRKLWTAYAAQAVTSAPGERLVCLSDGFYEGGFDAGRIDAVCAQVLERLQKSADVDLILTFGVLPTKRLSTAQSKIPVVALSCPDAVRAGVIASVEDAGRDNLHVTVLHGEVEQQVRLFHAVRAFSSLAYVVREDRLDKEVENELRAGAKAVGATYRTIAYKSEAWGESDLPGVMRALKDAAEARCDAVMFADFSVPDAEFPALTRFMTRNGLFGFAMAGDDMVARGMLLGVAEQNEDGYGLFEASVVDRILSGEIARNIRQGFVQRSRLELNLVTAMQMGWQPPFGVLVAVERAYTTQARVKVR